MAGILRTSCRMYVLLLPLYPEALRIQFGGDMADVFEQQVREGCERHGLTGLARVWLCAVADIIQNNLPAELYWRKIGIPVVSLVATFALFEVFARAAHAASHCLK
jgi:hypothetical protein